MSFGVEAMRQELSRRGYMRPAYFEVDIAPPLILRDATVQTQGGGQVPLSGISRILRFRCEKASTPGVAMATAFVHRYGIGVGQKMPHGAAFDDVRLQLITDGEGNIPTYFYFWLNNIANFSPMNNQPLAHSQLRYREEYQTSLIIHHFAMPVRQGTGTDEDLGEFNSPAEHFPAMSIRLNKAWPTLVAPLDNDWGATNQMTRTLVTFTYESWEMMDVSQYQSPGPEQPPDDVFGNETDAANRDLGPIAVGPATV